MNLANVLALAALAGAVVLLLQKVHHGFAITAVIAAALEVATAYGIVHLGIQGVSLGLVLGAALAICGGLLYAKVNAKTATAAAAVVTFVGLLQVLSSVRR